jgi:hypothetical protein
MRTRTASLVGVSVVMFGCGWVGLADKNYAHITQGDVSSTIHLIRDTPRVRTLIASHSAMDRHAELVERAALREGAPDVTKARMEFLDVMEHEPGVEVPGRSYARLLEASNASCHGPHTYVKVRITTGPRWGAEGWACYFTEISPTFP